MAKAKINFRSWKARAPKIPEYTCPLIDGILDDLSADTNITAKQYTKAKRKLERLRKQNDRLRSSGIYWYEKCKKNFSRIDESVTEDAKSIWNTFFPWLKIK
tara:strand:- start:1651 stop:1956 length:306 start_codon:yes stop_codon:yes gene_type:complete